MGKLVPLVFAVIGIGAGAGAGWQLKPDTAEPALADPCGEVGHESVAKPATADVADANREYVKLNNQFVVPVVEDGGIAALVVMSLSLEVTAGQRETIYSQEPKLRDAFLQVMFDFANSGGFSGAFTEAGNLALLRDGLRETARRVGGQDIADVLIIDVVRQDT